MCTFPYVRVVGNSHSLIGKFVYNTRTEGEGDKFNGVERVNSSNEGAARPWAGEFLINTYIR